MSRNSFWRHQIGENIEKPFFIHHSLGYLEYLGVSKLLVFQMHTTRSLYVQMNFEGRDAFGLFFIFFCSGCKYELFCGTLKWVIALYFRPSKGQKEFIPLSKTWPVWYIPLSIFAANEEKAVDGPGSVNGPGPENDPGPNEWKNCWPNPPSLPSWPTVLRLQTIVLKMHSLQPCTLWRRNNKFYNWRTSLTLCSELYYMRSTWVMTSPTAKDLKDFSGSY
jgi:hypothetical protein